MPMVISFRSSRDSPSSAQRSMKVAPVSSRTVGLIFF